MKEELLLPSQNTWIRTLDGTYR